VNERATTPGFGILLNRKYRKNIFGKKTSSVIFSSVSCLEKYFLCNSELEFPTSVHIVLNHEALVLRAACSRSVFKGA